jgi:hypothetical protein
MIGLIIEGTVAILLMVTIGYCVVLERRLRRLRADEQSLRAVIAELITATEIADRAISGLKVTVRECDQNLGERLRAAEQFSSSIEAQLVAGDDILRRLSQIAAAGRPAPPAPPPAGSVNPQSTLAAAQALVERARTRTGDRAA